MPLPAPRRHRVLLRVRRHSHQPAMRKHLHGPQRQVNQGFWFYMGHLLAEAEQQRRQQRRFAHCRRIICRC
jgi:hypothetical protein